MSLQFPQSIDVRLDELSVFKRVHAFGFNTCHAPIVMRSDLQRQMREAVTKLGMRYWRCHGTLSDDVGIIAQIPGREKQYSFSGLKRILDAGLASGVRPFFELSFMPSALARDSSKTITHYNGITSLPTDWLEWEKLVTKVLSWLLDTYGVDEVREWYFEVWNEPNIPFWSGTRDDYFKLYQHAARAIKSVDSNLRVGGPATARAEWVAELLDFCAGTETPVDFISTHIYPSDIPFMDTAYGDVNLLGVDFLYEHFERVSKEVNARYPGMPVIWGEWNSSAGPYAVNHDDCNNAALICAALSGMEDYADGSLYWNLSDIYEESQYHFTPFHGGYGLFSVDDIPKSSARAFELWNKLSGQRARIDGLPQGKSRGAFACYDKAEKRIGIVLWNYKEPNEEGSAWSVSIGFSDIVSPSSGTLYKILQGKGSAYEVWCGWGAPPNLDAVSLGKLMTASLPECSKLQPKASNRFEFDLPEGSMALLLLECLA